MLDIFSDISLIIASIGLVLATSSFISGLQLVKGRLLIERKIHVVSGYTTITLYVVLAVLSTVNNGVRGVPLLAWLSGLGIMLMKLYIVKTRVRAFKYVSWIGGTLVVVWLYLVWTHIPV